MYAIRSYYGHDFDNLLMAAECRAEADWLVGLNITRALTCKYDMRLSAGRVQTPTLGIIISREDEIENFRSESYWTISSSFGSFDAHRITSYNVCYTKLLRLFFHIHH